MVSRDHAIERMAKLVLAVPELLDDPEGFLETFRFVTGFEAARRWAPELLAAVRKKRDELEANPPREGELSTESAE